MHTRDNKLKIYQDHVHYNLRKYFFANRVICLNLNLSLIQVLMHTRDNK